MLKFACEKSQYYKQTFEAAGISAENIEGTPLENFPTIDKQILLSNFDKIITVSDITQEELLRFDESTKKDRRAFKAKCHVVHSSGSTGNREFLHPLAVEGLCIEGLMDYQFVQLENNAFEMRAQISADSSRSDIRAKIIEQSHAVRECRGCGICRK